MEYTDLCYGYMHLKVPLPPVRSQNEQEDYSTIFEYEIGLDTFPTPPKKQTSFPDYSNLF